MSRLFTFAAASAAILAFFAVYAMPQEGPPRGFHFSAGKVLQYSIAFANLHESVYFHSGTEDIVSQPIVEEFTCEGKAIGYYADVLNNCEIFHYCLPFPNGEFYHWSFGCPNNTMFDQANLVCNWKDLAFPCDEAPSLYEEVDFGRIGEVPESNSADNDYDLRGDDDF